MNRRDALQALAAATAAPMLGAVPFEVLLEVGREVRAAMPTQEGLTTLDADQAATLRQLAEVILPRTDTPGATDAGVVEFIDTLLGAWMEAADRDAFLADLAEFDEGARAATGAAFAAASETQQQQIVAGLDAEVGALLRADRAAPPDEYLEEPDGQPVPQAPRHFFYQMKRLTMMGYFTSEPGMTVALRYNPFPGQWDPCRPLEVD